METIFFQTNGNIYFTYGVPTMWELLWADVQWKSVRKRFQMDRILDANETKHSAPSAPHSIPPTKAMPGEFGIEVFLLYMYYIEGDLPHTLRFSLAPQSVLPIVQFDRMDEWLNLLKYLQHQHHRSFSIHVVPCIPTAMRKIEVSMTYVTFTHTSMWV